MNKGQIEKIVLETAKEAERRSDGLIKVLDPLPKPKDPKEVVLETMQQTYSVYVNLPGDFPRGAYPTKGYKKRMKKKGK